MQNSGLVRRIDELGRIVIPKEIRKTLRIRSGDPLEINKDGESLVLKKHSPIKEWGRLIEVVCESLSSILKADCVITDTDKIIYSSKKNVVEKDNLLTSLCAQIMNDRKIRSYKSLEGKIPNLYITEDLREIKERVFAPIVSEGDCYGLMVVSTLNQPLSREEYSLIDLALNILSKNL